MFPVTIYFSSMLMLAEARGDSAFVLILAKNRNDIVKKAAPNKHVKTIRSVITPLTRDAVISFPRTVTSSVVSVSGLSEHPGCLSS